MFHWQPGAHRVNRLVGLQRSKHSRRLQRCKSHESNAAGAALHASQVLPTVSAVHVAHRERVCTPEHRVRAPEPAGRSGRARPTARRSASARSRPSTAAPLSAAAQRWPAAAAPQRCHRRSTSRPAARSRYRRSPARRPPRPPQRRRRRWRPKPASAPRLAAQWRRRAELARARARRRAGAPPRAALLGMSWSAGLWSG